MNRRATRVLSSVPPVLAVLLLACAGHTPARADDCADAWITAKLKTRLMGKSGFGAFKINIETDQCVVTLEGCVDTPERRAEAAAIAGKVKKVKGVRNLLTICGQGSGGPTGGDCPDAMLTAEVKSLIFALEGFAAFKINVDTEECVTTLNGCVDNGRQIREAGRAARKAKGVKKVKNLLRVCPAG